jgi:putative ABC transport system permease protein
METLLHDLRFSLRQIRRNPAFAFFIIATLAIGIGANTTIFSALNALLLRPLPYKQGDRLVKLSGAYLNRGNDWSVSFPNAVDWREMNHTFDDIGYFTDSNLTLAGDGSATPERLKAEAMSPNMFSLLGFAPSLGRAFSADEAIPNADRVVVLSDGIWRRRFAANPGIIGTHVNLSGNPYTVIGVMPPSFSFPTSQTELFVPMRATKESWPRSNGGLQVIGRLKPGITLAQAQLDLDGVSKTLAATYPGTNRELSAFVRTLRESMTGGKDMAKMLIIVFAAVGFVLLIACVNVANLLLARASSREREVALRAAMGAGRRRIIQQFLTESFLLATLGGIAGALIAVWSTRALPSLVPPDSGIPSDFSVDGRVLGFTIAITALTGLLFGAAPALKASSAHLSQLLGGRTGASTKARGFRRNLLVVIEVGMAVVLLVSAGLMMRSFSHLIATNPGFKATNLLTLRVGFDARYKTVDQVTAFQRSMLPALRALPGVQAASTADYVPISGTNNYNDLSYDGAPDNKPVNVGTVMVGPSYVEAMGIPVIAGRSIDDRDVAGALPVAMVNRAFAEKYFGKQDVIGKRVLFGWEGGKNPNWRTVVGVFGNVLHGGLDTEEQRTEAYVPIAQLPWPMGSMNVVVRTQDDPANAVANIKAAIWRTDPNLALYEIRSMDRMIHDSSGVLLARLLAGALGLFGAIALLLAAIGLYGVISYSVAQRTYEIGVRAALGADTSAVLAMVLRQGMTLVGLGLAIGLAGSWASTRLLAGVLHGITPTDPLAFAGMSAVLIAVAFVATVIPARRAARIDPMIALRTE